MRIEEAILTMGCSIALYIAGYVTGRVDGIKLAGDSLDRASKLLDEAIENRNETNKMIETVNCKINRGKFHTPSKFNCSHPEDQINQGRDEWSCEKCGHHEEGYWINTHSSK